MGNEGENAHHGDGNGDDDDGDGDDEPLLSPYNSGQFRPGVPASEARCHVIAPSTQQRCKKARMIGALLCAAHRRRLSEDVPLRIVDCECHDELEPGADRALLITLAPNHDPMDEFTN